MRKPDLAIHQAVLVLKKNKAYKKSIFDDLSLFLKSKFKYSREVLKHDPNWKKDYDGFKNHVLSNIPIYSCDLWLNLSEQISSILNKEKYIYNENDINSIILKAEEASLEEYLKNKFK